MRTLEIRQQFIKFYEGEGYQLLPRASMLDDSIPMSFVMSAGLIQVERSLARTQTRSGDKFMLVQDCFRHFDLDKVGTDDFHLSIFEMPGAFKFGHNGKAETVGQMWHLATVVLGMDQNRLWASYFKGGNVLGNELAEDESVQRAWLDLGLPPSRVIGLGVKDNYWLQGKGISRDDITQKSGPNTELFYDRGRERACGPECQPGCKCGRFLEFSNSLFISCQVEPHSGRFEPLSDPFSETVIGIERVASILQGKESVFEIDSHQPILDAIRHFMHVNDMNLSWVLQGERVLADHLKAMYLLVAYHAPPPGKNGRERIIKLLIRRVITEQMLLEISSPDFLHVVLESISNTFQAEQDDWVQERVIEYFTVEKQRFLKTLHKGNQQLIRFLEKNDGKPLSDAQLLFLQKSMGLPYRLIEKYLKENGLYLPYPGYGTLFSLRKAHLKN